MIPTLCSFFPLFPFLSLSSSCSLSLSLFLSLSLSTAGWSTPGSRLGIGVAASPRARDMSALPTYARRGRVSHPDPGLGLTWATSAWADTDPQRRMASPPGARWKGRRRSPHGHARTRTHVHAREHARARTHTHAHTRVHTHTHHTRAHWRTHTHTPHACTYTHKYKHSHAHSCVHAFTRARFGERKGEAYEG